MVYLTFHSYSQFWTYPYGHEKRSYAPNHRELVRLLLPPPLLVSLPLPPFSTASPSRPRRPSSGSTGLATRSGRPPTSSVRDYLASGWRGGRARGRVGRRGGGGQRRLGEGEGGDSLRVPHRAPPLRPLRRGLHPPRLQHPPHGPRDLGGRPSRRQAGPRFAFPPLPPPFSFPSQEGTGLAADFEREQATRRPSSRTSKAPGRKSSSRICCLLLLSFRNPRPNANFPESQTHQSYLWKRDETYPHLQGRTLLDYRFPLTYSTSICCQVPVWLLTIQVASMGDLKSNRNRSFSLISRPAQAAQEAGAEIPKALPFRHHKPLTQTYNPYSTNTHLR